MKARTIALLVILFVPFRHADSVCLIPPVIPHPQLSDHIENPKQCKSDSDCVVIGCMEAYNIETARFLETRQLIDWITVNCSKEDHDESGQCIRYDAACEEGLCVSRLLSDSARK